MQLSVADLASTRFALSPLWEVVASVRVLKAPGEHLLHRRWARLAAERLRGSDLQPLFDLVPVPTTVLPAFLAPPPATSTPDIGTELAAVRALDPGQVRAGLDAMPPTPATGRFREDVPAGLDRLTKAVETYWDAALAPWWPRIRTLCEGDLLYRSRILAEGGARRLFADLSPRVSWRSTGTLRIENALCERAESLGGRGLLLVPSVFGGERVFSVSAEPWQPTVRYPPRGLGLLWREPDRETGSGLAGVIGHTRAAVLAALSEPATTTEVAARCRLSPGGASQQLRLLLDAGLVDRHRIGRRVLYARTFAAESLLEAGS